MLQEKLEPTGVNNYFIILIYYYNLYYFIATLTNQQLQIITHMSQRLMQPQKTDKFIFK
jgi:hypothetical protein